MIKNIIKFSVDLDNSEISGVRTGILLFIILIYVFLLSYFLILSILLFLIYR